MANSPIPTIHVATVHWKDDRWVDIQLRYLHRFIGGPLRTWGFLTKVPGDHTGKFSYVSTERIVKHATKLNLLADMICFAAESEDDWIVFLDGDAFPVAPLREALTERLSRHGLIAVRRDEKQATQPSPCFCACTVGMWRELGSDWHRIGSPTNKNRSQRSPSEDVGARLLRALETRGVDWDPLLRSNTHNPHPLFYAVYGNLVYHHGAGFRPRLSRGDRAGLRSQADGPLARLMEKAPRALRARYHPMQRARQELLADQAATESGIFDRIAADDDAIFVELSSGMASVDDSAQISHG